MFLVYPQINFDESLLLVLNDVQEDISISSAELTQIVDDKLGEFLMSNAFHAIARTEHVNHFLAFFGRLSLQVAVHCDMVLHLFSDVGLHRVFNGCKFQNQAKHLLVLILIILANLVQLIHVLLACRGWQNLHIIVENVHNQINGIHVKASDDDVILRGGSL